MCSHKDRGGVVVGGQHQDMKIAVSRLVEIPAREIGLCRFMASSTSLRSKMPLL
jgi:hypothetical protein